MHRKGKDAYVLGVCNLGKQPGRTTVTPAADVLKMTGVYQVVRIDSRTDK